ncbi:GHKL domain-containing protein [Clostridium sp. 19966]|uniref:sensor histidine kinase n=1 Tax=Clostridium sp. 19966 TaxID=2768166 RepID=UPI0028EABEBD|nr:GHKL domain-containing protein [Clostridium sp. 19966]
MLKIVIIFYPAFLIILFTLLQIMSKKISFVYYGLFYAIMITMIYGNIISSWELQLIIDVTSTLVLLLSLQNSIFIRKNYEDKFGVYQDKVLANQMEEVNSIYLTMRGWRHDYHNHMQKIKAHIAMNQIAEVKEYLNQLESDLDSIDVKYKSGNVSLDAILNSKLSVAEKLCININCKAAVPEKLSISDIDLCVIIGNLIDNAMEACENIKSGEKKFLRIYICVRKQQLYISVTNSTNELIRKLNKEYISSKRGNHGHGLKRIDNIVEKHEGFINRKNEPGVFATEIMLPLAQI